MHSILKIEEVMRHDGTMLLFVESAGGSFTVPLPEVDAFCAALQARAMAVREEAGQRAERRAREEAPA